MRSAGSRPCATRLHKQAEHAKSNRKNFQFFHFAVTPCFLTASPASSDRPPFSFRETSEVKGRFASFKDSINCIRPPLQWPLKFHLHHSLHVIRPGSRKIRACPARSWLITRCRSYLVSIECRNGTGCQRAFHCHREIGRAQV